MTKATITAQKHVYYVKHRAKKTSKAAANYREHKEATAALRRMRRRPSIVTACYAQAMIAHTYGDVRSDHLLKQAQRIQLTAQAIHGDEGQGSSIKSSITSPDVPPGSSVVLDAAHASEDLLPQRVGDVTLSR
jgi:hypothetical protein